MCDLHNVFWFLTSSFRFNLSNLLLISLVALGSLAPTPDTLIGANNAASLVIAVYGDVRKRDSIFPLGPLVTLPFQSTFPVRTSAPLELLCVDRELNSC